MGTTLHKKWLKIQEKDLNADLKFGAKSGRKLEECFRVSSLSEWKIMKTMICIVLQDVTASYVSLSIKSGKNKPIFVGFENLDENLATNQCWLKRKYHDKYIN